MVSGSGMRGLFHIEVQVIRTGAVTADDCAFAVHAWLAQQGVRLHHDLALAIAPPADLVHLAGRRDLARVCNDGDVVHGLAFLKRELPVFSFLRIARVAFGCLAAR